MSTKRVICAIVAAGAVAAVAAPGASAAAAASSPPASAKLTACRTDPAAPAGRAMTVVAAMKARPSSVRLDIRFDLFQRTPGADFRRVVAPGLGTWLKSNRAVRTFNAVKTIQNLSAPATYRVVVRFRWIGPRGGIQAATTRTTAPCVQPDPRPDLRIGRVSVAAGAAPRTLAYTAVVRNGAPAPSSAFDALLRVDGEAQPALTVAGLGAFEARTVTITAPRCTPGSGSVSLVLDPDNRVAERDESNNTLTVPCRRS